MTLLQVVPPTQFFGAPGSGYLVTQAGVNVTDQWEINRILKAAAIQGVTILQDGVGVGVPADGVPEPQVWEYDWTFAPAQVVSGGFAISVAGGMSVGRYGIAYNSPPALNNEWRWRVPISRGSWRMDYVHDGDPSRCITTWEISYDNGATWNFIGTVDLYRTASNVQNLGDVFNFTSPFTGVALLRVRNPTKNPLGGTYWTVSLLRLTRTA